MGKKRGRPKRREEFVGATVETAAKLQPDVVQSLVYGERITDDEERKLMLIRRTYETLSRGMLPSGGVLNERSKATGMQSDMFTHMSENERNNWQFIYKPWANLASKIIVKTKPRLCGWSLAIKLAYENVSLEDITAIYQLQEPALLYALSHSLSHLKLNV